MAERRFSLSTALRPGSPLRKHVKNGMSAFARTDLGSVAEDQRSRVGDSLDLDAATRDEFPEANRWDYILSVPALRKIVAIEPHSAKDSEISVVVAKKKHAVAYLRGHLQDGCGVEKWFWVSPGTVGFSRMDRARRRLDQNGIEFVGRLLRTFG